MSENTHNAIGPATSDTKSKKKRKNKKKGGNLTAQTDAPDATQQQDQKQSDSAGKDDSDISEPEPEREESDAHLYAGTSTETSVDGELAVSAATNGLSGGVDPASSDDPTARFDALVKDRDALRAEVTQLRESLERIQSKHNDEMESIQKDLEESQGEKERAEDQYQNLLGKVHTLRSQLGERLKENAEELAQAQTRIEELEEQRSELQEQYTTRSAELEEVNSKHQAQEQELNTLRNRATLSQQNWVKERNELIESEAYIREEFENAKQAMHDWEVLAMEERQIRRDLADRVADLEEQLTTVKTDYERAASERDTNSSTVDGLQKAMQEIQDARRKELREVVENSQSELQTLRKQLEELQTLSDKSKADLEETKKELDRTSPFEKEVKEKNLLIGKLRHEAVILNDHLTKALRFLKKGKPDDNVDRQIVTNHFLQFLALDRSDPKKFQILQIIAALLNWTDEQKEQAGLARPGAAAGVVTNSGLGLGGSLRIPMSPLAGMHRTPSTPSLSQTEYFGGENVRSPEGRESLAELWQNFLEQEASSQGPGQKGRSASVMSTGSGVLAPPGASK